VIEEMSCSFNGAILQIKVIKLEGYRNRRWTRKLIWVYGFRVCDQVHSLVNSFL